ncbi:MAG: hypothetical protein FJ319_06585 [SAR202 cluster bacterium]|nr:hypothetical protein [SAR202 cluster bacterium]
MILFRSCPRCGGDVDSTFSEDVKCIQRVNRPEVAYPGPRVLTGRSDALASLPAEMETMAGGPGGAVCPRCGDARTSRLGRLREEDNVCFRCRKCAFIFSPSREQTARAPEGGSKDR